MTDPVTLIRRLLCALGITTLAAAGGCEDRAPPDGEAIAVPSGRAVSLIDVIGNVPGPAGATTRFRFLAPGLTEADLPASAADMLALCETYALPRTSGVVPAPQQIIISLADRVLPFGEAAPEAVQFFEAYRIDSGTCVVDPY